MWVMDNKLNSLSAYEITNHWHREPPPKEILEDLTAKGGAIMDRTLENFERPATREETMAADGSDSDSDEGDEKTPKHEKVDGDDPGSAVGRSTRGTYQSCFVTIHIITDT